ncbi:MAG: right-handed parallel beta-helix repeat-containing protein [Deltaproteobacteria bacterium]|nr:right-handed parallel beta-helix repeat-containing protein [Deltaproteobacteria bacterium]
MKTALRVGITSGALLLLMGACAPRPLGRDLHSMPITSVTGDTLWRGEITVDRIVVVRRGGHLRILPGTKIFFRRVDWDGDGIGDAELTVEGRLTAEGTAEAPILFTSAEPIPRPSDWKYLLINFAEGASLGYARFSHAYSGVQVHYSPARILRCEFAHNVDGVRFSTARLRVEGCWIHGNQNGVRFEERGHPAEIVANEISDNGTGIFPVAECRGKTVFRENNILRNGSPVKMGLEQREDLSFPGNYWGTEDEAAVLEAVVDRRSDPALGRVTVAPMLPRPAKIDVPPLEPPDDPDWRRH